VRRVVIILAAIVMLHGPVGIGLSRTAALHAQEGHPLTGTWAGDWGAAGGERTHITGLLNPGPDQSPLTSVSLDPATWTVRLEAEGKDASGRAGHVTAEGKLEDIASYHRTITGTWTQGTTKGTFKLTRD